MNSKHLITFLIILVITPTILAGAEFCIKAEVADISPSSVGIDETFTVGIHIESCGTQIPKNISFELINPPADISIQEPLIIQIPKMQYANSERFLTYHMKTTINAKPGTHLIKTRLAYNDEQTLIEKDYNITIDVIADEAELDIASVKTDPILPYEGDTVELTLRIENFGDGAANSVKVYAEHPFKGIKESFIGTLSADEDGPAIFTFITKEAGEFEFPVKINYKDDFGENEINSKVNIVILKKKTNWLGIILSLVFIALAVWFVIYFFKIKKQKDKIIQQLLKGNGSEIKKEIEHKSRKTKKSSDKK